MKIDKKLLKSINFLFEKQNELKISQVQNLSPFNYNIPVIINEFVNLGILSKNKTILQKGKNWDNFVNEKTI